eukprot:6801141-Alexandrium_andersonii.AAC.1
MAASFDGWTPADSLPPAVAASSTGSSRVPAGRAVASARSRSRPLPADAGSADGDTWRIAAPT